MAITPIPLPDKEWMEEQAVHVKGGSKDITELPRGVRGHVQNIVDRLNREAKAVKEKENAS